MEGYDTIDEDYYRNFPLTTTYYGETDVIWSAGPASDYPKNTVEIIQGEATIIPIMRKSNKHIFIVDAKIDSKIVDHTQYFPGWRVEVDGVKTPIEFQDPSWRGEITFNVEKGRHKVEVIFGYSKIRAVSQAISIIALLGLIPLWFYQKLKNK